MTKNAIVIGSGFAGLSAACYLAKEGFKVTILEKNNDIGGRARVWKKNGFTFDLGPSWYWMPDVFEKFFADFGYTIDQLYDLKLLEPSYRVWFDKNSKLEQSFYKTDYPCVDVPSSTEEFIKLCEKIEVGSSEKVLKLLNHASFTYKKGVSDYMRRPSTKISEFLDYEFIKGVLSAGILKSYGKEIDNLFKSPQLRDLLKFPTLFLGTTPDKTPYLYSLMLHAAIVGKTWYPMGGMFKIIEAMTKVASKLGVTILPNSEVTKINVRNGKVISVSTKAEDFETDFVVASGDYAFIEQNLLDPEYQIYSEKYWNTRTLSPSSLIFYWGIKGKVENFLHHNLFFHEDFKQHSEEIYNNPEWPTKPLFYVCNPSKTDLSVAPEGYENMFVLIPIAPGLKDDASTREKYKKIVLNKILEITGQELAGRIVLERTYCIKDFEADYHALKGNAYGLANSLKQTAIFKPRLNHPKIKNLVFAGQLTVPGPGMPPSLISGQLAANYFIEQQYASSTI
jgi:phytoene desaturase